MPKRRNYKIGGIYHIYNRGIDKKKIFLDYGDHERFINNFFVFNDVNSNVNLVNNSYHFKNCVKGKIKRINKVEKDCRSLFVEVLSFCLMPNHFHLLLRPKVEDGIQKFMQKFISGYSLYFNDKYERSGPLFQGRYKDVPVEDDNHFNWLPYYIHCNPLDLKFPSWRKGNLKDMKKAIFFLDHYRWSSHLFYLGENHFPLLVQKDFLKDDLGLGDDYFNNFKEWLSNKKSFNNVSEDVILESKYV
ncbi:MAG: transposase [Candidatus Paceibacterota bacterium]